MNRDLLLAALLVAATVALAIIGVLNWYTAHIRWGY